MSSNILKLTRVDEGKYEIPKVRIGTKIKDLIVENWVEDAHSFSVTPLLAAATLSCITTSTEYEFDVLKKGARYDALDSSIKWKYGKDETGRNIIDSMEININVKVPDDLRTEFEGVIEEHMNHYCSILRSLKKGIAIKLNINEI